MAATKPNFTQVLQDSLSGDANVRVPAEAQLSQYMDKNFVSGKAMIAVCLTLY
jgi:hypothetical protein